MATYNFTGANGDPLPSGLTAQSGSFQILDNKLATSGVNPGGPGWVCTQDSQADTTISAVFNSNNEASPDTTGICFRYQDNNNLWIAVIRGTGELVLFKRQNASFTNIATYIIPSFSTTVDYTIQATLSGSNIDISINGTPAISAVDSFNSTASKHGLRFGSSVQRMDDLAVPDAVAGSSISVDNDPTQQAWSRTQSNNASVTITGTYTGTPTTLERSVDGGAWTEFDASPSGGAWSDTFTLATGAHSVAYRFGNNTVVSATLTPVVVGEVVVPAGQSNASGRGTNNQTFSNSAGGVTAYTFGNDDSFTQLSDPYDSDLNQVDIVSSDSGAGGSWVVRFANEWLANNEVPLIIIPVAKGGSAISEWARSISAATLYGSMKRRVDAVGGCNQIFWHQGERDSADAVATDGATYQAALVQLAADFKSDFGCDTWVIALQTITATGYSNQAVIRQAQIDAAAQSANIEIGQTMTDIDLSGGDGLHFRTDAELELVAQRVYSDFVATSVESGYNPSNPPGLIAQMVGKNGASMWEYDSADSPLEVRKSGYFADGVALGMKVGDVVTQIDTVGATVHHMYTVKSLNSDGSVNLSDGTAIN